MKDKGYPPLHEYNGDTSEWGKHIQRTMGLLEESTHKNPNTVRILFYGQSIMGGRWHVHVESWLRETYPSVRFDIRNYALGGYSAALLYRTARQDLHPFYPDLMIFHVAGDHFKYEQLIFEARQKTTCEIMIMTDHWSASQTEYEVDTWSGFFEYQLLPQVCEKYSCERVDVRWPWKEYVQKNNLVPQDVLIDQGHLNEHGKVLMAELCKRQMIYRPELTTEMSGNLVNEYLINEDIEFTDGKLTLEFEGNRADIVSLSAGIGSFSVKVDGTPPSEHPESYSFSRPSGVVAPDSWTNILKIGSTAQLQEEDWFLEILEIDETAENFRFALTGSVTGPDGEGSNTEKFASDSGKIVIEPDDWGLSRSVSLMKQPARAGMKLYWRSELNGTDVYVQPSMLGEPAATTLYQGGCCRKHILELTAHGDVSKTLYSLRTYAPPVPEREFTDMGLDPNEEVDESGISAPTPDLT